MSVVETTYKQSRTPTLSTASGQSDRLVIDEGLLHYEASLAGRAERYRRGETPQTVHVWWARRPHRAMRALVYANLCTVRCDHGFGQLAELTADAWPSATVLESARRAVELSGANRRVLDMFGGGGTIAYESLLLGAETYAVDSNELSVFIQKALLEFPQRQRDYTLSEVVESAGRRVLERLRTNTEKLFPLRNQAFGYIWTYSLECSECGYTFFLSKRPWLSRKRGQRLALVVENGEKEQTVDLGQVAEHFAGQTSWVGRNGRAICPKCQTVHSNLSIKTCQDRLVALIESTPGKGKVFEAAKQGALPCDALMRKTEKAILRRLGHTLPSSQVPRWSGIVNPSLYGIETHSDVFGVRQRVVLLTLIEELRREYTDLKKTYGPDEAKTVVCLLSGFIDQLVDWNCRLSMWISQNEQVGRAFSGPGVAMLWDYVETDPVLNGPANLWSKLDRIIAGTKSLELLSGRAIVKKGYAQELPFASDFFDAIVTDPPYYDNIFYNVLADFFFSWKRLLFADLEPDLFAGAVTDESRELVASSVRSGTPAKAHEDYCRELTKAVAEAERVLKPEGVFSLVYSHSSFGGWEAIVRAYRASRLHIMSAQPLSIERRARPRAMTSDAVNTCVVLVSRKSHQEKQSLGIDEFTDRFRHEIRPLVKALRQAGWHEMDLGMAAFSQGVGLLCNVSGVHGIESDRGVLIEIARAVQNEVPEFRIVERKSL